MVANKGNARSEQISETMPILILMFEIGGHTIQI